MPLLMIVYLLLAMNIKVYAGGALSGWQGSFFAEVGAAGLTLRIDGTIDLNQRILRIRKGREIRLAGRRKRKPALLRFIRAGRFEAVWIQMRLGLPDAAQTAVAAGAVRSSVLSAAAVLGVPVRVFVEPDYHACLLLAAGQGIYSFRPGDIILAAIKAALNRKKREGFAWKNIPLKA